MCTQALGGLPEKIAAAGVPVIPVGQFKYPLQIGQFIKVWKVIRKYRPHIIHGAVFEGVSMAVLSGKIGRVPVVLSEETSDPVDRSWRGNLLMRGFVYLSDNVVAMAPATVKYLKEVLKTPEEKIKIIHYGVEVDREPGAGEIASLRASLGIGPDDFVVGSVGRLLDAVKRFSDLIKAVSLLRDQKINVKLLIVGDGEDKETLEGLALELGVAEQIIFAGYQSETAPFYGCMDVFGLASSTESFGMVLVEAMLARLPVVATAVGGIPYVVEDRETGILVAPFSPSQLAAAIEELFRDAVLCGKLGEAGYARAMAQFSARAYVQKVEEMYLQLCREKGII